MKTLYLDCGMGAAGDMLTGALLELLPDPEEWLCRLNRLGIPGVRTARETVVKCGVRGTHITVTVNGKDELSELQKTPDHHCHSGMGDVRQVLDRLDLPEQVRRDVLAVYGLIAEAESQAHGVPVTEVHFCEVGMMDAIADVTAVCLLMNALAPDQVVVSPVHVGCGQLRCAHGLLPVPGPATAYLLRGVPIYGGSVKGELCTPTGAALLRHFATRFGDMPVMAVSAIGHGMGKKDFEAANCVRAMLGDTRDGGGTVTELRCNVDDMTPEAVGFAMERLFDAGALEVYTVPVGMKKSRPGVLLCVMCREADRQRMTELLFRHTTTIGIRESVSRRYTLQRTVTAVDTPWGTVHRKDSAGYGVSRQKYEYEDLARIAREKGVSLADVIRMAEDR